MALLPAWRNRGIGSALLQEVLAMTRASSLIDPYLYAEISVLFFYRRMGFQVDGGEFLEMGIRHRRMVLHDKTDGPRTGSD